MPVIQLQNLEASLLLVLPGILFLLACLAVSRQKVPPNFLRGVRKFKVFKSKENWHRINCYFAEQFLSWCIGMIVVGLALLFIKRNVPVWITPCLPIAGFSVAGGKASSFARRL